MALSARIVPIAVLGVLSHAAIKTSTIPSVLSCLICYSNECPSPPAPTTVYIYTHTKGISYVAELYIQVCIQHSVYTQLHLGTLCHVLVISIQWLIYSTFLNDALKQQQSIFNIFSKIIDIRLVPLLIVLASGQFSLPVYGKGKHGHNINVFSSLIFYPCCLQENGQGMQYHDYLKCPRNHRIC